MNWKLLGRLYGRIRAALTNSDVSNLRTGNAQGATLA